MSDDGEEPQNHERWVVSYADFITLLFATFAALYAISFTIDRQKAAAFEQGVRDALDAPLVEKITYTPPSSQRLPTMRPTQDQSPGGALKEGQAQCAPSEEGDDRAPKWFGRLHDDLDRLGRDPKLEGVVEVQRSADGEVLVRLLDLGLFAPGDATLQPKAQKVLDELAARLRTFERIEVHVEGHTDDRSPGQHYPTNWELSAARATAVVTTILATGAIGPERLSSSGFAEFRPVADNSTEAGRARNRRIDLVIRPHKRRAKPAQTVEAPEAVRAAEHWRSEDGTPDPNQLRRAFEAPLGAGETDGGLSPNPTPEGPTPGAHGPGTRTP